MVVMGVTRSALGTVVPRRRRAEGSGFGIGTEQAAASDGAVATTGVAVTSLLALQESESGLQQDREARRHGDAVMEELSAMQRALLSEDGPNLDQLALLMARPITAADPALAGVLRAVRLRAGIELARHGRAASM